MLSRCLSRSQFQRHAVSTAFSKSTLRRLPYPTPPTCCRRRLLSSESSAASSSGSTSEPRRGGGMLIAVGWVLLGVVAVDQALQYRQDKEDQERFNLLVTMQRDANTDEENVADWGDIDRPTLFECKLTVTDVSLDGTKMLRHIKTGDVVEVMEADIGPNKAYNLCRCRGSIGWYPIKYMERID